MVGWWVGHLIGSAIHAPSLDYFDDTGQNDISILLGYLFGVIGFLVGLGFANYPVRGMLGHPPTLAEHEDEGAGSRGTSACAPTTRSSRSSTSSGSACSSSSAGSTRC